jgi:predicted DsbA family dithiol-disulfide isomerase
VQCCGAVADPLRIPLEKIPRPSIRVVPFFVVDRLYGLSGAPGAEQQLEALQRAWAEKHSFIFVGSTGGSAACGPDR